MVSTFTLSPVPTNGGTLITRASLEEASAGFITELAVAFQNAAPFPLPRDQRYRDQNANGLLVVILDLYGHVGDEVVLAVADHIILQRELFVILGVHKVMAFAIAVEVIEFDFIHRDFVEEFLGAEAVIQHRAVAQIRILVAIAARLFPGVRWSTL